MMKIFKTLPLALFASAVVLISSCERESLDEVLSKEEYPGVGASLDGRTDIGTGSSFTLTGSELSVPITVQFSAPTTRAFNIALSASSDNVPELIAANKLPSGTIPVTPGALSIPSVAEVPLGVSNFTFTLSVGRSFIETNYGKNIAFSVKISGLNKDNTIAEGKDMMVVFIKTGEVMKEEDVHYIDFASPGKIFAIPSSGGYEIGSESITVRVPITLTGDLGAGFTVEAVTSPDSVTKYIQNGFLTNSELYPSRKISVQNPTVRFDPNTRRAELVFITKRDTLLARQPAAGAPTVNKPVVAFTLRNPSKYQLGKKVGTVFVSLDANFFRPYNGTPFVIRGGINQVSSAINAAYYDFGGINVAWWDNGGKSGDGNWRLPDFVDVAPEYTPRAAIGWTARDEYVTFSVYVEETGTYEADMYWGLPRDNGRYRAFMDNVDILGGVQSIRNTGAHGNQLSHKHTVQLTKGYHIFKVFVADQDPDYRCTIFTRKS